MQVKDHLVSGELFVLEESDKAGVLRTSPIPHNLEEYYQSEAYVSHTDRRKSLRERLYYWAKRWNLKRKTALVANWTDGPGRLLDIGAGTGDLVRAAAGAGWDAVGIEPHQGARTLATKKGVRVYAGALEADLQPMDCVSMWHVLEHIPDLDHQVATIKKVLKPSGILILALPNHKAYDAEHYGPYWAGYDVPRHVWHFTRAGVKAYFDQKGFELKKTYPMWLDAFYVSWLSERYQGHSFSPLRGFLIGFWSNLKALRSKEASSLIYILQKRS